MEAVRTTDVHVLTDAQLHEAVVSSQRAVDVALARQASLVSEWHARKIWADNGSKSAGARLARETGLSVTDANHVVHRARRLQSMPLTLSAFATGSLCSSRVDLLVRANAPVVSDAFVRDEEVLLREISSLSFRDATRVVRYWSQRAAEDDAESRGEYLAQSRSASVAKTFEGVVDLRALFDPVNGELFATELERLEQQLFRADWAEAKRIHGDDVTVECLARTNAQRRCDALVLMATRSACAQPSPSNRPLVNVLVDYETFGRVCELASGTVIAPGMVVPLLDKADVRRIVFEPKSIRITEVGRRRRFFRGAVRKAIEIRDRHCTDPSGRDEPPERCDVDHGIPWSRRGPTDQLNGKLLCAKHNRRKGCGP